MTLASSGAISMQNIATELGVSLPLALNNNGVLTLAGKSALPVTIPGDFHGKKAGVTFNGLAEGSGTSVAGVSLGAVGPSRRIIVAIHYRCSSSSGQISLTSVTIGGTAATIHTQEQSRFSESPNPAILVGIASAIVATGTTGTVAIEVNNDSGTGALSIGSYRAIGSITSPSTDAQTAAGASSVNATLTVAAGDSAIVAATMDGTTNTLDVSGLAGGADAYDNNDNSSMKAGSQFGAELAGSTDVVNASQSGSNNGMVICGMAWAPG